jgi:hypothetical protein
LWLSVAASPAPSSPTPYRTTLMSSWSTRKHQIEPLSADLSTALHISSLLLTPICYPQIWLADELYHEISDKLVPRLWGAWWNWADCWLLFHALLNDKFVH